ncbi:ricin-type beta-trefoil lectin domain protein [Actinoallomurus rhizosphaericola]|uniref:ricin-type beta-trefoil lectin domain protein n=1 Tax=Actinoallomurus rhizosphaericola TaxID=2952536 RepID=UPI0020927270|nr:ricin-type beta-trefoil lectin domain protein [Actinoallomurus rhizosphaericola]MCO5999087.1 ricin-type beta-trefoil lectin domain protein [Actinoallomurus rhizosphaericola]
MTRPRIRRLIATLAAVPLAAAALMGVTAGSASAAANPGPGFPAHYAAPYAEMWNDPSTLMNAYNATGNKYYTLAFVISQGTCNATINGDTPITDAGWNNAVNNLRAAGGDVIVSFGGAGGTELTSCGTVAAMQAQYQKVIDQFNLTRIDLDIEGSTLDDTAANDRRNQALANLQQQYAAQGKTLTVDYTLPVSPSGLESDGIALLQNAKSHNLNVNLVNIMTMDYGGSMDMGQAAISAANGLHTQLGQIWTSKTSSQLWAMEGNCPMIGVNDVSTEVFTTSDAQDLESFAASNGIQELTFWSLGRDNQGSSGTPQSNYQFTGIFKAITGGGTTNPPPGAAPIHGYGGKCVDVAGAGTANGTKVDLYTCNGTNAQLWTHSGNTFQALGKCLDVTAAGTADGAKVQLYDCNGTGAQSWTVGAGNSLVNTNSGKCLDDTDWSTADGNQLQIWTCTGAANQSWTLG